MKLHIAAFGAARRAAGQLALLQLQSLAHFDDIFPGCLQGGKFGDIALQQLAGLQQFKRTGIIAMIDVRALRRAFSDGVIEHVDPGAAAHFDQPFNLQHDQRLADHGAGHVQHLGDFAFRR